MKRILNWIPFLLGILLLFPFLVPLTKIGLVPFILLLLGIFYFVKKTNINRFGLVLFCFSFLVRLGAILLVDTPIISDFKTMFDAARQINAGNLALVKASSYFSLWSYQFGHTLYMSFFLKFLDSAMFLKVLNCLFSSGSIVLLYKIGKIFTKEKTAQFMSLLYALFPFPLLLNTVLTNQHHAAFFFLLALYLLLYKNKKNDVFWKRGILIGICLALSNILRPEAMIFLVAFLAYFILHLTQKDRTYLLKLGAVIFLSYFALTTSASLLLQSTNISEHGLKNNDPYWKFMTGLNVKTTGQYSEEDAKTYPFGNKNEAIRQLTERIQSDLPQFPTLFLKKETILWTQSDLSWSIGHFPKEGHSELYLFLTNFNQCFIYFFLALAILGCFTKSKREEKLFLILLVGAYFGVYLWIEIMPRYAYLPQMLLLLLGMIGVNSLFYPAEKQSKPLDKKAVL